MEKRFAEEDRVAEAVEKAGLLSSTVKIINKYRKEVAKRDAVIGLLKDEIGDLECEIDSLRAVIGYLKDENRTIEDKLKAKESWGIDYEEF